MGARRGFGLCRRSGERGFVAVVRWAVVGEVCLWVRVVAGSESVCRVCCSPPREIVAAASLCACNLHTCSCV